MKKKILVVEIAVGYMLKVLKSKKKIIKFKEEFAAIRHGDYYSFINQIGGTLPFIVTYSNGNVYEDNKNNADDFDFVGLLKSGHSLKIFYDKCIEHYGEIVDNDIPDLIYCKLAYFELSLRMHYRNKNLFHKKAKLEEIIEAIGVLNNLNENEISTLHSGRRFLNMVKHGKMQLKTWQESIDVFLSALQIIEINKLTII